MFYILIWFLKLVFFLFWRELVVVDIFIFFEIVVVFGVLVIIVFELVKIILLFFLIMIDVVLMIFFLLVNNFGKDRGLILEIFFLFFRGIFKFNKCFG